MFFLRLPLLGFVETGIEITFESPLGAVFWLYGFAIATDLVRFTVLGQPVLSSFYFFCNSLCDGLRCFKPDPLSVTKMVRLGLTVNYLAYFPGS